MHFEIIQNCKGTNARAGLLKTDHGFIETPIFMPVGTAGSVKGVHQHELENDINAQIILGNTYHLYLKPGIEILNQAGGLHSFMSWHHPILTDSGGYQVYSLSSSNKINENGVRFQSHHDGSYHVFTPEKSIEIQRYIGADLIMAFDECTPYPCTYSYAKKSMEMTHRWLQRCMDYFKSSKEKYSYKQALLPIVQGSTYSDLRKISAETVIQYDSIAYAIGGLSVGEPIEDMYSMTELVCEILPKSKARYLMGVGTPSNILESIHRGIDMMDCVMPTRNARHGLLFTSEGTINIKNKKWENDFSPIDNESTAYSDKRYSKAYLRHLIKSNEYLGIQVASIHNLHFYLYLVKEARKRIIDGTFVEWKNKMIQKLDRRL